MKREFETSVVADGCTTEEFALQVIDRYGLGLGQTTDDENFTLEVDVYVFVILHVVNARCVVGLEGVADDVSKWQREVELMPRDVEIGA